MKHKNKLLCSLYRHYNAYGELLYVGISKSIMDRMNGHEHYSHWFDEISYIKVEHFATRDLAKAEETKAIINENPLHNIAEANNSKDEKIIRLNKNIIASSEAKKRLIKLKRAVERENRMEILNTEEIALRRIMGDAAYEDKYNPKLATYQ